MKKDRMDFSHKNNVAEFKTKKANRNVVKDTNNIEITDDLLKQEKRDITNREIKNKVEGFYRLSVIFFITGFAFAFIEILTNKRPISIISPFCFALAIGCLILSLIWQQKLKK